MLTSDLLARGDGMVVCLIRVVSGGGDWDAACALGAAERVPLHVVAQLAGGHVHPGCPTVFMNGVPRSRSKLSDLAFTTCSGMQMHTECPFALGKRTCSGVMTRPHVAVLSPELVSMLTLSCPSYSMPCSMQQSAAIKHRFDPLS